MSETRKPILSATLKSKVADIVTKIEVFDGSLFSARKAVDILGSRIPKESTNQYVRLRINGKWFPAKSLTLYTKEQFCSILVRFSSQ